MITIIAGSRKYKQFRPHIIQTIKDYIDKGMVTEVLCGMAEGADLLGKQIAEMKGISVREFPADWNNLNLPLVKKKWHQTKRCYYNALAGIYRNNLMAKEAEFLIAIWDKKSKGTKDMIDQMRRLNKPMLILFQEESE